MCIACCRISANITLFIRLFSLFSPFSGGIARNVFSPILSGGGVVLCPGFDPILFWDLLSPNRREGRCTWYYASPTMHQAYVEEAASRAKSGTLPSNPGIRFIANAAGALLPALAERMKTTFNCSILPGYGMTECSKYIFHYTVHRFESITVKSHNAFFVSLSFYSPLNLSSAHYRPSSRIPARATWIFWASHWTRSKNSEG